MDSHVLLEALRATGSALGSAGPGIRVCVCGGGAGLLAGGEAFDDQRAIVEALRSTR